MRKGARHKLKTFVASSFDEDEARQFLTDYYSKAMHDALPGRTASFSLLVDKFVSLLERHNKIDERFFALLRKERGSRKLEIDALEALCLRGVPLDEGQGEDRRVIPAYAFGVSVFAISVGFLIFLAWYTTITNRIEEAEAEAAAAKFAEEVAIEQAEAESAKGDEARKRSMTSKRSTSAHDLLDEVTLKDPKQLIVELLKSAAAVYALRELVPRDSVFQEAESKLRAALAKSAESHVERQKGQLDAFAFSADGVVAVGASGGSLTRWELGGRGRGSRSEDEVAMVRSIAVSPGGQETSAITMDGNVHVWGARLDGAGDTYREGHATALAYSRDGELFAAGYEDGMVRVRTSGDIEAVAIETSQGVCTALAVGSLNGADVVVTGSGRVVKLVDVEKRRVSATSEDLKGEIRAVTLGHGPSESRVLVVTDRRVLWWSPSGHLEEVFRSEKPGRVVADLSPLGDYVLIGTAGGSLALVATSGQQLGLVEDTDAVHDVAFRPDQGAIAVATEDGVVRVFPLVDSRLDASKVRTLWGHETGVEGVWFVEFDQLASLSSDGVLRVWPLNNSLDEWSPTLGDEPWTREVPVPLIGSTFAHDGNAIVVWSRDRSAWVFRRDVSTRPKELVVGKLATRMWVESSGRVTALTKNHELLVSEATADNVGQYGSALDVCFDGVGRRHTIEGSGTIVVDGEPAEERVGAGLMWARFVSGCDAVVYRSSRDEIWFVRGVEKRGPIVVDDDDLVAIAANGETVFAANNERLLVGHWKGANPPVAHGYGEPLELSSSADGEYVIGLFTSSTAVIWSRGDDGYQKKGEIADAHHARVSADGRFAVTASDKAVQLHALSEREPSSVTLIEHETSIKSVEFDPSGELVAATEDGRVRVWRTDTSKLVALACARAGRDLSMREWGAAAKIFGEEYRLRCNEILREH